MRNLKKAILICLLTLICSGVNADTIIKILHTNDTHARIIPIDSKAFGNNVSGIARRASIIKSIKTNFPEAMLLDSGDMFQGTPFFNFFKGEACYKLAKASGYDATTLGNHELDLSLENLLEKLQNSQMLLLCCNVFSRTTDKLIFEPYKIFSRAGKKIGVIGSIGDDAWESVDKKTKAPLYAKPQLQMVREYAKKIRSEVDLIVVLSHSGFEQDQQMAAAISEIDVILGGHTHSEVFHPILVENLASDETGNWNNGLKGTIITQAGEHGIFLGNLQITLGNDGKIATFSGELTLVASDSNPVVDPEIEKLVEDYHSQLKTKMAKVAGKSQFALIYPMNLKKTHLLPMGSFTAAAMKDAGNADVCLVNSGGIRAGIPAGNITYGQVYEALPYDNTVVTFLMNGKEVKEMLNWISKAPEKLDAFQYAGLSGIIDIEKAGTENIKINNEPIDENKIYRICTSSFIANGNLGGETLFAKVEGVEDSGVFMRDAAINYLEKLGELPDYTENPLTVKRP